MLATPIISPGIGYTELPGADVVAEQMRRQTGVSDDVSTMTLREMQNDQQQRFDELRAAFKRSS